jgi:regulator of sigma E protease
MAQILFGILGLALLMVIHEGGHYLAARAFAMRVTRFSIGFGPALFRHTPKDSPTTYQIAVIPLLAYVQIAGMNPLEEVDPADKGSYANASLFGRITTIFAGPLANYLFASVLFFAALLIRGTDELPTTRVDVLPDSAAAAAQIKDGDKIVEVGGQAIGDTDWNKMKSLISKSPGKPILVAVEREGRVLRIEVTPRTDKGEGRIGVTQRPLLIPITMKRAAVVAIERPAQIVVDVLDMLGRMLTGKEKPDLSGPVGIVRESAKAAQHGLAPFLGFLGVLSAYLGAFNLLPIPALDGGRLLFLGYEAATRRRANPRIEAQVHAVGLVMMLALLVFVTFTVDIFGRSRSVPWRSCSRAERCTPTSKLP